MDFNQEFNNAFRERLAQDSKLSYEVLGDIFVDCLVKVTAKEDIPALLSNMESEMQKYFAERFRQKYNI